MYYRDPNEEFDGPEDFEGQGEFEQEEETLDPSMEIDDPLSKTGGTIDPRGDNMG